MNWDLKHLVHRALMSKLLMLQTFLGFLRPISDLFVTEGACELKALHFAHLSQNGLLKQSLFLRSTEVHGIM